MLYRAIYFAHYTWLVNIGLLIIHPWLTPMTIFSGNRSAYCSSVCYASQLRPSLIHRCYHYFFLSSCFSFFYFLCFVHIGLKCNSSTGVLATLEGGALEICPSRNGYPYAHEVRIVLTPVNHSKDKNERIFLGWH